MKDYEKRIKELESYVKDLECAISRTDSALLIAEDENSSARVLAMLAKDECATVREAVALNFNTSIEILANGDVSPHITVNIDIGHVIANPPLPIDEFESFIPISLLSSD